METSEAECVGSTITTVGYDKKRNRTPVHRCEEYHRTSNGKHHRRYSSPTFSLTTGPDKTLTIGAAASPLTVGDGKGKR